MCIDDHAALTDIKNKNKDYTYIVLLHMYGQYIVTLTRVDDTGFTDDSGGRARVGCGLGLGLGLGLGSRLGLGLGSRLGLGLG